MNHGLGADTDNLFAIISQRGNKEPVVYRVEPNMVNAPFHIRQGDGSGQHKRSGARRRRVLLSTHLCGECHNQDQDKTRTTPFSQCSLHLVLSTSDTRVLVNHDVAVWSLVRYRVVVEQCDLPRMLFMKLVVQLVNFDSSLV